MVLNKSFAEGQDIGSYLGTIPGARKGLIDKGLSVADTGYESRMIVNTNIETKISEPDCGTKNGREYDLNNAADVNHRLIQGGPDNGRAMDDAMRRRYIQQGKKRIKMRTPLTCEASNGVCQKCAGKNERGQFYNIGFHIGALAGQTIGERATQVTLKSFHTGGAVGGQKLGFGRIQELLEMPQNVKGKATISKIDGKVTKIDMAPAGGHFVFVDREKYYVPSENPLKVRVGQAVRRGQPLSEGPIKPQELLEATGDIHKTRDYLIDELSKQYEGSIRRNLFETAFKPMTDKAKVTNPGDGIRFGVTIGDITSVNKLEGYNKQLKASGGRQIQYEPMIMGIKQAPLHSQDFVGALGHQDLKKTLSRAPALGLTANLSSGHPITQLALTNLRSIRQIKGR
jgi:DNA-directed RNA polymerase subunit beta'